MTTDRQDADQAPTPTMTTDPTTAEFTLTPAEVRAKWVEALRSGRYRRGTGQLCERGGRGRRRKYCCLGVLCDVVIRAGMDVVVEVAADDDLVRYDGASGTLPESVMAAAGLATDSGELVETVGEGDWGFSPDSLVDLNDGAEWSLRKIADLIERGGVRTTDWRMIGQRGSGTDT